MDDNFAAIIHKDAAALNRQYTDDYYRIGETARVTGKSETIAGFLDPNLWQKHVFQTTSTTPIPESAY